MKNFSYKKLFEISIFSKGEVKRDGYMKMIYGTCPNCGNSKSPFWVKISKCSKCGADKFKWHTRAWCGNMLNPNMDE